MKTNYTPGPWAVGYCSPENLESSCLSVWQKDVLDSGFGSVICKVSPEKSMNETDKANAQLIAAAPELLAKCVRIVKWLEMLADAADKRCIGNRFESLVEANKADARNYRATAADIQKVIAKATGETVNS